MVDAPEVQVAPEAGSKPKEKKFKVVVVGEYFAEQGSGRRRNIFPYSVSFMLTERENRALGYLIARLPAAIRANPKYENFVAVRTHRIESDVEVTE